MCISWPGYPMLAEKLLSCDDSSQLMDTMDEVIAYVD